MMREYFDIELKDQCKRRMKSLDALSQFGGIIHDRHESRYFCDRQAWRNPVLLRVSLPEGKRWEYIRHTIALGCGIWLARPPIYGAPEMVFDRIPRLKLRGKHEGLKLRRSYCFAHGGWIKDFQADGGYIFHPGTEILVAVLNGEIDLNTVSAQSCRNLP